MELILVPHFSGTHSANIWLCVTGVDAAPADFTLTIEKVRDTIVLGKNWRPVEVGDFTGAALKTFVQTHPVDGLEPHTRYVATAAGVSAAFATLPDVLPRADRPFNVLLSSCCFAGNAGASHIGVAMDNFESFLRPHVKILCGDQVYMDAPELALLPFDKDALARLFLGKYLRNWGKELGYQGLLRTGSTYFTADDHEFWNNHPNRALHLPATFTQDLRDRLDEIALTLYKTFQSALPVKPLRAEPGKNDPVGRSQKFDIGRLSFLIADTRVNRKKGEQEFMAPGDLDDIVDWLGTLSGPGVLVVGQPVFEKPAGFFKRNVADRVLPDYEQYETLVRALSRARHTVLVLTGDVHFSRVASAFFRAGTGPEIIEVIASPSAVVKGAPGKFAPAPDRFPVNAIHGVSAAAVETPQAGTSANNFATLQFFEVPPAVKVRIRHWATGASGAVQVGREIEKSLT